MALVKVLPALGAMPGFNELARCFLFKCAANSEFHIAHLLPRNPRTTALHFTLMMVLKTIWYQKTNGQTVRT
jgi:hypothetical protein